MPKLIKLKANNKHAKEIRLKNQKAEKTYIMFYTTKNFYIIQKLFSYS